MGLIYLTHSHENAGTAPKAGVEGWFVRRWLGLWTVRRQSKALTARREVRRIVALVTREDAFSETS
jgi:hypothetical protein